jgi:hypothetical protein
MKHTFALVLATLGLSACTDTLDPRPEKRPVAPTFEVAEQYVVPGSAAAVLGDLAVGDPAVTTPAAPMTADQASSEGSPSSVVLPNAYTDVMGESNNTFPHAFANMRYQQVFLEAELQGIRAIDGLCLRRDQFAGGPAGTQQLTVKLGPTVLNHTNLTPVFDANYAAPPTTVFSGDVNIPLSTGGGTPDDFYICIDFTTNYIHAAGFNLIVEIVNTSEGLLIHFVDACQANPGCTTRRVFAFSATAAAGFIDPFFYGLVMKVNRADPSTKEECKDGGWENFGFRNQGQCVRFIETGEDSR